MSAAIRHFKIICLSASIALVAPEAFAQSFDTVRLSGVAPGRDGGTVGAAVVATHQYQGSDTRRAIALPLLDYQWANGWFAGVTNGIGYNFSNSAQTQYGLRLTADAGREEHRSSVLHGMGNVDAAAEGGVFFNYLLPDGVTLTSSVRYGSGNDQKGLVVDLGAAYGFLLASKWRLGAGTALTFANAHAIQSYFGVTSAQSAASGYAVDTVRSGFRDVRANVSLTYVVDQATSVTTVLGTSTLLGGARASQLTRERTSSTAVVAIAYAF